MFLKKTWYVCLSIPCCFWLSSLNRHCKLHAPVWCLPFGHYNPVEIHKYNGLPSRPKLFRVQKYFHPLIQVRPSIQMKACPCDFIPCLFRKITSSGKSSLCFFKTFVGTSCSDEIVLPLDTTTFHIAAQIKFKPNKFDMHRHILLFVTISTGLSKPKRICMDFT